MMGDNHFVRSFGFYPILLVRYLQEIATQPMLMRTMLRKEIALMPRYTYRR
uniref:Uncharacterized protein n=1 Tax=Helianthus annuus TaxID=4232 RepID=A0A251T4F1_HELAN